MPKVRARVADIVKERLEVVFTAPDPEDTRKNKAFVKLFEFADAAEDPERDNRRRIPTLVLLHSFSTLVFLNS